MHVFKTVFANDAFMAARFLSKSRCKLQARFNVSVSAAKGMPALCNTAETSAMDVTGFGKTPEATKHSFEVTPPMATYLLGIVVGDLDKVEGVYKRAGGGEVPVRVWGRTDQTPSLMLALDVAVAALKGVLQRIYLSLLHCCGTGGC